MIRAVMVVTCLELPNKGLDRRGIVGVICLEDESGAVKVNVDNIKKIWKEHMEKLMNLENEWSDSINASKVEDAVTGLRLKRCGVQ